jgi:hypothetical protein
MSRLSASTIRPLLTSQDAPEEKRSNDSRASPPAASGEMEYADYLPAAAPVVPTEL